MKNLFKVISALALLSCACLSDAKLPESIKIGSDTSYAPFDFIDKNGEITGFNIEITKALCEKANIKCEFQSTDFDALIPSLLSRKIDMISSSLMMTEKRKKQIAFSDEIFLTNSRLITKQGANLLPNVESLKGKRVGVEQGTSQEHFVNDKWRPNGVIIVPYQNQLQVFSDLVAGRLDAALQDEVTGSYAFLKQPQGKDFAFAGEILSDKGYFDVGVGLGFRKKDDELREAFNKALVEILNDGTYQKINDKYFDFNVYSNKK
ncbi:transporter substrate-binding domain-containing protein [Gilliamella sp. W8126]|uniref:lysine/arginine/ornithine ABC transporter substrate-binding protein n=1 Tax=unclassified Gilliamella TaxID=2685620 RepID=UPI0018DD7CAC|nr:MULTISPECIES: lysine/arginine/ornithine ABC transporter substrate-binding protein [unclassified Gilliamella]MBI0006554.1 transporter substrate-binding domain-containing protein [Gilliamella sp. W8126]MBI0036877.1 transporter substrate-binding domain-containing protein [Gilliamella sp. B14384G10]MBI0039469.1 transporter substrate-binding domain-containing protein [Gilliamella sp. B14384G7]MBI0050872.1 transporter substrate-binding domain-containing protein [Gilliamella sp. B14384G13]MBI00531